MDPPPLFDIVVAGAGMAGLCAAVEASELGVGVCLLERGERVGGALALSGGILWGFGEASDYRRIAPGGDGVLQAAVAAGLSELWAWLEAAGVVLEPHASLTDGAMARRCRPSQATDILCRRLRDRGATVRMNARVLDARPSDGAPRAYEVEVARPGGLRERVQASALLLATGGCQGDEGLVCSWLGIPQGVLYPRHTGLSDGDGLRVAEALGGACTALGSGFYGHNLPAPPARLHEGNWLAVTQYHGPRCLALNWLGKRFCDESEALSEEVLAQETARQPQGEAFYLFDRTVFEQTVVPNRVGDPAGGDRFGAALAVGACATCVPSLDALVGWLDGLGVPAPEARRTIERFNAAVAAGEGASLDPPRRHFPDPLSTPPFRAIRVRPGITFTMGGLAADAGGRVLGTNGLPVPGLLIRRGPEMLDRLAASGLALTGPHPEPPLHRVPRMHNLVSGGAALVRLEERLRSAGGQVLLGERVQSLLVEGGVVIGLFTEAAGEDRVRAWHSRCGVVLATGPSAAERRLDRIPAGGEHVARAVRLCPFDRGDGHLMGVAAGGRLLGVDWPLQAQLRSLARPHVEPNRELARRGVWLDARGAPLTLPLGGDPVAALLGSGEPCGYLAWGRSVAEVLHSIDDEPDGPYGRDGWVRSGKLALCTAPTVAYAYPSDGPSLGGWCEGETVGEALDRAQLPRSNATELGRLLGAGPFVVWGPFQPVVIMNKAGLHVDARTRVLDVEGRPVLGLWAVGNAAHVDPVPGHGYGLAWALTSGQAAAVDAARRG